MLRALSMLDARGAGLQPSPVVACW